MIKKAHFVFQCTKQIIHIQTTQIMKKSNKEKPQWPIHDEMDLRIAEKLQRMDDYITRETRKYTLLSIGGCMFIALMIWAILKNIQVL